MKVTIEENTEDHLIDKTASTYDPVVAERWLNKGWPVTPLYYAPQSNQQILANEQNGMSLRDWFAGLALQGICASGPGSQWSNEMLSQEAYQLADAMIKAREKQE